MTYFVSSKQNTAVKQNVLLFLNWGKLIMDDFQYGE